MCYIKPYILWQIVYLNCFMVKNVKIIKNKISNMLQRHYAPNLNMYPTF